jgi:glycosyltransferase involved in cell wall biosynthesis
VIWGGVDTDKFSPDPTVAKNSSVLYVGRLVPHKGVNYLIEGLPDGLGLDVVGPASNERFVVDLRKLAEGKNVRFHHGIDDNQLVRHYRNALCIVLPSVHRTMYGDETVMPELLGQTLLEGMACGLPALCTNVAAMPEVVTNGLAGFTVAPNDSGAIREKLIWFRDHPAEGTLMGKQARQRVLEKFSWGSVVDRCLDVYRTLL